MVEWKDIPGYEGIYQASTAGDIRTAAGKTTYTERHGTRVWKSRVLKGRGNNPKTGKRVSLWKDGKVKDWLVARLVAITFLGDPPDGFTVNHKDGNRMNNALENLEWLSRADNIRHGFATGLYKTQRPVSLVRNGIHMEFSSISKAAAFLDRSVDYVSKKLQSEKGVIFDARGEKYELLQKG